MEDQDDRRFAVPMGHWPGLSTGSQEGRDLMEAFLHPHASAVHQLYSTC